MFSLADFRTISGGAARGLAVALAGILVAGCVGDREAVVRRLREDDPRTQVATIAQVVRAGDRTFVPELIDLLESEDEGVRFMAASALHKLTGKDLGFHFANTPAERARIVAEWRTWWEDEGRATCGAPATESAAPPSKEPSGEPPKEKGT
jgi:hypothetical protein